jgi:hypothetical protein
MPWPRQPARRPGSTRTSTRYRCLPALAVLSLLMSGLAVAGVVVRPAPACAAPPAASQCNAHAPGPLGATTALTCTVTIVNTIDHGTSSSTVTLTRTCGLEPCDGADGTFTTTSANLVTSVDQCNGADNDTVHPVTCNVTITNNISADTPGASPLTGPTANQCVGSGGGAGGSVNCSPFPANTAYADVTQCNGSAAGVGGQADCTVEPGTVSAAIPFSVNQCNGTGNTGATVLTCDTRITTRVTPDVSVATSSSATSFGTAVTLTSAVGPGTPGGTVSFHDVATSGPDAGHAVLLGTATVAGGTAGLTLALPAFGTNSVTATYSGDGTYGTATSTAVGVDVSALHGSLVVNQFRLSGPGGPGDQYVELYNPGAPVPLAGFRVATASGGVVTLPSTAPTLDRYRSYLVTGGAYSLAAVANPDVSATSLGTGGVRLVAPDTAATVTDAVGATGTGYFSGTPLAALTGSPLDQYAWVRNEVAGRPVDTGSNAADFTLVSTTGDPVGGVSSTLGTPSPRNLAAGVQHNATLTSALLDNGVSAAAVPNRASAAGSPGTLVVRRTVTNNGPGTVTSVRVRLTSLSEVDGPSLPGASPTTQAHLRLVAPTVPSSLVPLSGSRVATVQNLTVDAPAGVRGGGLASTLAVPLPPGGLTSGASVDVSFTFAVDRGGAFWFGYNVEALDGSS